MVGCHHQLNGHEFGQTPGDSGAQGSLACCHLWGWAAEQQQRNRTHSIFINLINLLLMYSTNELERST